MSSFRLLGILPLLSLTNSQQNMVLLLLCQHDSVSRSGPCLISTPGILATKSCNAHVFMFGRARICSFLNCHTDVLVHRSTHVHACTRKHAHRQTILCYHTHFFAHTPHTYNACVKEQRKHVRAHVHTCRQRSTFSTDLQAQNPLSVAVTLLIAGGGNHGSYLVMQQMKDTYHHVGRLSSPSSRQVWVRGSLASCPHHSEQQQPGRADIAHSMQSFPPVCAPLGWHDEGKRPAALAKVRTPTLQASPPAGQRTLRVAHRPAPPVRDPAAASCQRQAQCKAGVRCEQSPWLEQVRVGASHASSSSQHDVPKRGRAPGLRGCS